MNINFANWFENEQEFEIGKFANQWQFETHLLNKLFPTIVKNHREMTFNFIEKENRLIMDKSIVEIFVPKEEVVKMAQTIFNKVELGFHAAGSGLKFNMDTFKNLLPYPMNVEINDLETGYWECEAFIIAKQEDARVIQLVADFEQKVNQLATYFEQRIDDYEKYYNY